jgi:hypothetical protein
MVAEQTLAANSVSTLVFNVFNYIYRKTRLSIDGQLSPSINLLDKQKGWIFVRDLDSGGSTQTPPDHSNPSEDNSDA